MGSSFVGVQLSPYLQFRLLLAPELIGTALPRGQPFLAAQESGVRDGWRTSFVSELSMCAPVGEDALVPGPGLPAEVGRVRWADGEEPRFRQYALGRPQDRTTLPNQDVAWAVTRLLLDQQSMVSRGEDLVT